VTKKGTLLGEALQASVPLGTPAFDEKNRSQTMNSEPFVRLGQARKNTMKFRNNVNAARRSKHLMRLFWKRKPVIT